MGKLGSEVLKKTKAVPLAGKVEETTPKKIQSKSFEVEAKTEYTVPESLDSLVKGGVMGELWC